MELFGIEGIKQRGICFLELPKMICACLGAVRAKGDILEGLRVALWPGRGDAGFLQEPGIAIIIALLFH